MKYFENEVSFFYNLVDNTVHKIDHRWYNYLLWFVERVGKAFCVHLVTLNVDFHFGFSIQN